MPPQNQDPNQAPQPSEPNPAGGFDPNQNNQPQQTPPPQPVAANGAQTPPNPYNSSPEGAQPPQPAQPQPAPYQQPPYDNSGSSGMPPQGVTQNPDTAPQPTEPIPPEVPITSPSDAGGDKTKKIVIISAIVAGVLLLLVAVFSLMFTDPAPNGNGTQGTSVEEDAFNGDTDPASPDEVPGPGGGNGDDLDFL